MHTTIVYVKHTSPLMPDFKKAMEGSCAARNAANLLIRHTYDAMHKDPSEWTAEENTVLLKVWFALNAANERKAIKHHTRRKDDGVRHELKLFRIPDAEHSMLSYGQLDAILKITEDKAYYSCSPQVSQQAIRKTCASWSTYFVELEEKKKNPERFYGRLNIPGNIRDAEATARFTNQTARFHRTEKGSYLSFPKSDEVLKLGKMPVRGKYIGTEVRPCASGCRVMITFDDGQEPPTVPEMAERVLAIDPGVNNFAACVSNTGMRPFLIDGKFLKSVNHWYNKKFAFLTSRLTAGKDPQDKSVQHSSKAIEKLSEKREKVMRDWFYKTAHYICRKAADEGVTLILYGHNAGWKQNVRLGRTNNQNFMQIPFVTFFRILRCVAEKYGIAVDMQEESYSSKSDFLCCDVIPAIGEKSADIQFSGKRINRGLYRSGTGDILNADVNGAANILRKRFPDAFDGTDKSVVLSVVSIGRRKLYPGAKFRAAPAFHPALYKKENRRS